MIDRTKLAVMLFFFCSILLGAAGAQGCNMYTRHNAQHAEAEADHQLNPSCPSSRGPSRRIRVYLGAPPRCLAS